MSNPSDVKPEKILFPPRRRAEDAPFLLCKRGASRLARITLNIVQQDLPQ